MEGIGVYVCVCGVEGDLWCGVIACRSGVMEVIGE